MIRMIRQGSPDLPHCGLLTSATETKAQIVTPRHRHWEQLHLGLKSKAVEQCRSATNCVRLTPEIGRKLQAVLF